jgi:hypothetical protein
MVKGLYQYLREAWKKPDKKTLRYWYNPFTIFVLEKIGF